ncbi:Carboxymuconolactone decarboxylase [Hyella patelloides LEGE 07179]|uniref:Carboxymuconolactone decarboxylase n=1 Tax=Hyella patelloides LEGE 07179 TaxID=945734 RepID=A0A563VNW4_9CYAN|nr:carboxymuconolactone decarboxylase family protein [Hyella patelloides]VEP13162.1 Carboxymuconolactone decarboxylase [Hyella patelloides LEGE 07179]
MMFPLFDENTAPEKAKQILAQTKDEFKMIPNLEKTMALAPALLESYVTCWNLFDNTSLSPIERQIVYQTANFENECDYCVPWHTLLAKQVKMSPEDIEALRNGAKLTNSRHEALRIFTQSIIRTHGKIAHSELDTFLQAGYTPEQALEVVLGIAIKTMSNYTNAISGTPLDRTVKSYQWSKPTIKLRKE